MNIEIIIVMSILIPYSFILFGYLHLYIILENAIYGGKKYDSRGIN